MPWGSSLFPLLIVTSSGKFTGLFVYSPGPGAGKLVASITAQAGTDPFGNAFLPGDTTYVQYPGGVWVAEQLDGGTQSWYSAPSEAGPWTLIASETLTFLGPGGSPSIGLFPSFGAMSGAGGTGHYIEAWLFPSGDVTGAQDVTNLTNLFAGPANLIHLLPGTFYLNASVALASGQRLIGSGQAATIVKNVGNAVPAITAQGSSTPTSSQFVEISGMTIDGSSATGAAEGIRAGDITHIRTDVIVQNFPSGAGIHLLNQSFWTEQASITATVHNCGTGIILDAGSVSSHSSFERTDIDIFTDLTADQFAITWQGGQGGVNQAPLLLGGRLRIRGNHTATAGGTGALINMSVVPYSRMQLMQLDIAVETDAGGATAPQTIRFKDATCLIDACYGSVQFLNGGGGNWQASNNSFNFGLFNGFLTGDTTLQAEPKITEATLIAAGFPGTISGQVLAYQPRVDGLVFIGVNLSIPNGTVLTNNTTTFVAALPSWAFMTHHQQAIECDLAGTRVPLYVTGAGSLVYGGPTQTLGSTQTLTGQAMITNTNFPW